MDEFVPLFKFTPSAQDPEILERITVQREDLIASLVESALDTSGGPSHHLLIGPRGMGKTHILTLVASRIRASERTGDILLSWLDEDPWQIRSYEKLLAAIATGIAKETEDAVLARRAAELRGRGAASGDTGEQLLREVVGKRTLVLLIENLDEVFHRIGPEGQARLRSFLEDWRQVTIVATAAQLFEGIQRHASPFYGYFAVTHLEELSLESATELMRRVAELRGNADVLQFLSTETAKHRLRAIEAMAGGHPRVWLLLASCISVEAIDELVPLFLEALDDLTPYYQSRLKELGEQQQELVILLSEDGGALTNQALAERSGIAQNQVATILRQLTRRGYVRHAKLPPGLADGDKRMTYWELREPLMRLCLDVKQSHGEPLRMVVEFLRTWYGSRLLDELARLPDSAQLAATYAQEAFRGLEGKLSAAELLRGSPKEILTRTEIGLALTPEDPGLRIARVQALLQEDRLVEVRDFLDPLVSVIPPGELSPEDFFFSFQLVLARTQLDEMNDQSLYDTLVALTDRAPDLPSEVMAGVHSTLGAALGGLGRYSEALEAFERAVELDPEDAFAHLQRGEALMELNRDGEALEAFERAVELDPEDAASHARRGASLSQLDRPEEALEAFEQAAELDRTTPGFPLVTAVLYLSQRKVEPALQHLQEAFRRAKANESLTSTYPDGLCRIILTSFKSGPQRADLVAHVVNAHTEVGATDHLGRSLIDSIPPLMDEDVSQKDAESWAEEWEAAGAGHVELEIPLEILRAAVAWKKDRDKAHLLTLPVEQREILTQLLPRT
jgi:tetratricopeptide (TPR) repeat protein